MPHILNSSHTEKLGVAYVQSVCAKARTIFRTITTDDVGIDGFIEVVEESSATGVMAGVQIKSGASFTNSEGTQFKFIAEQKHYGYWARCSLPMIGVVYSPTHDKAIWLDLREHSTDKRIVEGPYTIAVEYTAETEFTPSSLLSVVVPTFYRYIHQRRNVWQIQQLITPAPPQVELSVPSLDVSGEKDEAWKELIEVLCSPSSTDDEIADAGYRLSWYFPAVSKELHDALLARLSQISDFQLTRIVSAIHWLLDIDANTAAELIVDLIRYVPHITIRIEELLRKNKIPSDHREAAIQIIEVITTEFQDGLRAELGS